MNNIYDNGSLMIGNLDAIINYIESDETLETWEYEDLIKDLYELKNSETDINVVMVNYENPMGYSIDYWHKSDKVKEVQ